MSNNKGLVDLVYTILYSDGYTKTFIRNKYIDKIRNILVKTIISYEDDIVLIKFIANQINSIKIQYKNIYFNYDNFLDKCLFPESFFWNFKSLILEVLQSMKKENQYTLSLSDITDELRDCIELLNDVYDERITNILSYKYFNEQQFNSCLILIYKYWKIILKKHKIYYIC